MTVTTARRGAFTPWAAVVCAACEHDALTDRPHYVERAAYLARIDREAEVSRPRGHLVAVCDDCGSECWVREDVAILQRVRSEACEVGWDDGEFGATLEQTGGLCCALVLDLDGRQVVVTALDDTIAIGLYAVADPDDPCWDEPLRFHETAPLYLDGDLVDDATLGARIDEAARIAVEFARPDAA